MDIYRSIPQMNRKSSTFSEQVDKSRFMGTVLSARLENYIAPILIKYFSHFQLEI
jgi:hypothetical protein